MSSGHRLKVLGVGGGWGVFFFQAEDGIRDWSVTGVQTCALPIWMTLKLLGVSNLKSTLKIMTSASVITGRD